MISSLPPKTLAVRLRESLQELSSVLKRENENNWRRGVEAAVARLKEAEQLGDQELRERLEDVASIYQTMHRGAGSSSDFHIWRENYEERLRANEPVDELREEIWRLVSMVRDLPWDSEELSEAIVIWTGWGETPCPTRDESRVINHFGAKVADKLLPMVRELEVSFYSSDAHHSVSDLAQMTEAAMDRFRHEHPEIMEEAVQALGWCYGYDFK